MPARKNLMINKENKSNAMKINNLNKDLKESFQLDNINNIRKQNMLSTQNKNNIN